MLFVGDIMAAHLYSALLLTLVRFALCNPDPLDAVFAPCDQLKGAHSTNARNGFAPGLYVVSSNLPGATIRKDGKLANRNIVCAHEDRLTSGGTVVIPWAAFDKRDANGRGSFDWGFVEQQMAPWVARGQKVNLLVWPAVQKEDQSFPAGQSATPQYIIDQPDLIFQCPDGTTQGTTSLGALPLPKFWRAEVYTKYAQALRQFVARFEDNTNVNYFRFGIGVGAESYPANGATTPNNFCVKTFIQLFPGPSNDARANTAFSEWSKYVAARIRAFRRFNSRKAIIVTLNDFRTKTFGQGPNKFPDMIAYEATREYNGFPKLGLGVQGATTKDVDRWEQPQRARCNANWCAIFNRNKDSGIPLQLQTPTHSGVYGPPGPGNPIAACQGSRNIGAQGCMSTGNMVKLISFALQWGVRSFELYPYEWFVANDKRFSTNPELDFYDLFGEEYRAALNSASNQRLA
ncbi:hypothetical protein BWQ96_10003 [Gracilariopsis chorda]|uniref:Glycoside hydrolase family 42 N-terminal domain-containing protein n=1 Tax=Gracilariopsis chorda TaxID=448386 RepID=A0A2V3IE00_9FLOR|nr:hypothetical protein BWQ96_10003 [Gracilariopsis chorda]|eukprot:PXF40287.1 hypothetical protein BWQ96_10003 [Gracilariopsis chorda]